MMMTLYCETARVYNIVHCAYNILYDRSDEREFYDRRFRAPRIHVYNDNISATAFTLESYFSRAPAVLSSRCSGGGVTCVLECIYIYTHRWEHRIIIIIITALIVNGLVRLLKSARWKNIHCIYVYSIRAHDGFTTNGTVCSR